MRIFKGQKLKVDKNGKTEKDGIYFNNEMKKYKFIISDSYNFPIAYDGWYWYEWMLNINNNCLEIV